MTTIIGNLTIWIQAAAIALSIGSAHAACTPQDMQGKAGELQAAMMAKIQKDPSKAQEITQQMQSNAARFQTATDSDSACKAYDELIAQMKR